MALATIPKPMICNNIQDTKVQCLITTPITTLKLCPNLPIYLSRLIKNNNQKKKQFFEFSIITYSQL